MTRSISTAADLVVRTDDGAELAVTVEEPRDERGPTVVLVHGWGAARAVWHHVAGRLLTAGHRVVRYDHRGHGASTVGKDGITVERLGADLAAVLAQLDITGAVLVGHSGGGFAAMSYATTYRTEAQARVRSMVLLATAAHDRKEPAGEVKMMGNPVFHFALNRGPVGRAMLRQTLGENPSAAVAESNRRMFAGTPRKVRQAYFGCMGEMDMRADLTTVSIPAVVIAGSRDKMIRPELGAVVADSLPDAEFRIAKGIGHMVPLEAPDVVAAAVTEMAAR
ncbi:putative hydrolase [Alloactinosynnema sp. L-07]|uniref:alpha/beta fold hydrolase n=1 Tax=Alloactinosynnema sp. L-07 TaxID=1653480 RepID=UPI00065EF244|nr:alpha/beta hydrolase [Alloactinosynnema sp. L-07]CRK62121.1 putative hydrolase [Alloactinosynnema sp. L-07]